MAEGYSGVDLIDDALDLAVGEQKTAEDVLKARRALFLVLTNLSAEFANNARIGRFQVVLPARPGIAMPDNVEDVLTIVTAPDAGFAALGGASTVPVSNRLSDVEYAHLSVKDQGGTPSSWYLERTEPPTLFLHPVGSGRRAIIWYYKKPDPFDDGSNDLDAPDRWKMVLVKMVAAEVVARIHPVDEAKVARLKADAAAARVSAQAVDRHRSPFRVTL